MADVLVLTTLMVQLAGVLSVEDAVTSSRLPSPFGLKYARSRVSVLIDRTNVPTFTTVCSAIVLLTRSLTVYRPFCCPVVFHDPRLPPVTAVVDVAIGVNDAGKRTAPQLR